MARSKFKKLNEYSNDKEKRTPVSIRLKDSTRKSLEKAASKTKGKLPLSSFLEKVLDDYVEFLKKEGEI